MFIHSLDNDLLSAQRVPGVDKRPTAQQVHAIHPLFLSALASGQGSTAALVRQAES